MRNYRLNPNPPPDRGIAEVCQRCRRTTEGTNTYQVLTDHGWAGCCVHCYERHLRIWNEPARRF